MQLKCVSTLVSGAGGERESSHYEAGVLFIMFIRLRKSGSEYWCVTRNIIIITYYCWIYNISGQFCMLGFCADITFTEAFM